MTANSKTTNKKTLISYQQALEIIQSVANSHSDTSIEKVQLSEAKNRILAKNILSPINVPSFNNSAMDGFALKSEMNNIAIEQNGRIVLEITGSIQAGDQTEITIDNTIKQFAWEIMTGAPVPNEFDAVIQIENVIISKENSKKYITISEYVKKGKNIRKLGTDYQINQSVLEKYTVIQAQHIMALATVGIQNIDVVPRIRVAILSTGNELAKNSSTALSSGEIFNSNQPFLQTYSQELNCQPVFTGRCKDNIQDFDTLIESALVRGVKIIFSTGAVSMGKYDFIPQALLKRGAKIHFHKAKIRPGKPILFAEFPDGTIYFGLPGNPIAAASGLRFFVSPFIRTMLGLPKEELLQAKLLHPVEKKQEFRTFAKAYATINKQGQMCVDILRDQGSYQSRSYAQSNCWLILPENKNNIQSGEIVDIAPMIPHQMNF